MTCGVPAPPPQRLGAPPPPPVWGAAHAPQLSGPPQPSEMLPQFLPCAAQVVGVHVVEAGLTVATTMFQSVAVSKDIDADCPAVDDAILSSSPVELPSLERIVK